MLFFSKFLIFPTVLDNSIHDSVIHQRYIIREIITIRCILRNAALCEIYASLISFDLTTYDSHFAFLCHNYTEYFRQKQTLDIIELLQSFF